MPEHQSDAAIALATLPPELRQDVELTRAVAACLGCQPPAALHAAATLVVGFRSRTQADG